MNIKDRNPEKKEWTIEIRPKKRLLDIDLKGLWLYRDLFYMYVKRDRHYKIFCVNGNTGFRNESRIFYFIHLQNEKDYERKESSSA